LLPCGARLDGEGRLAPGPRRQCSTTPLVIRVMAATPAAPLSSLTLPVLIPPSTGTSLVPLMVTVTCWLAVPSKETAVKLSVSDWPAPSCWIAVCVLSAAVAPVAARVQREGAVVVAPRGAGWTAKVDWPWSTSAMLSTPLVIRVMAATPAAPLSSLTLPVLIPPITGTSLVPLMVTVTCWLAVPSKETAVKLSVSDWPAPSCWIAVCVLSGGVAPVAARVQREGAVVVAPRGARLDGEGRLALVHVGNAQHAAGHQGDGGDARRAIVFADAARADPADHRYVVGAVDGDRDLLARGAIEGDRGEAVGERLAGAQLLDRVCVLSRRSSSGRSRPA